MRRRKDLSKRKTPKGVWALRAVTATIAIVVLIVIGTIAYSAYEDYDAIRSELAGGSRPAVAQAVIQGSSEIVSINVTFANKGLYTLNVNLSCTYPTSNVVCQPSSVAVPPGQTGTLRFRMTVVDVAQFANSSDHKINGTVGIEMQPFVTLNVETDFGGFVSTGGA